MSWLHYLIEANIYLGVFYLCYCLFLNRDTHYMLGRVYLIFSCVVAFVLPVTQLSILKPVLPEMELLAVPTQVTNTVVNVQQTKLAAPVQRFTFDDAMVYIYITGAVIGLLVLLFRLRKLYILTRNNHSIYKDQYKLINLNDENTAFSFFNYLFIGSNVPQAETIIAHELVHIRQKHSIDIIFLEIMKIVNWFNPFIYLIQRSLKTIHEYIADEQTVAHEQDALAYSSFLLNNAYGIQGSSIAHSFFNYNLLKKRIIMLNKNRSGKLARLKYLAALPLCAGMLCASTLVFSKDYGFIDLAPRKAQAAIKPAIDSAKYALKVTNVKTNISVINDIMLVTDAKTGLQKIYRAKTLTDIDKAELLQNGMKVEIVTGVQADSMKKLLPPPPPPSISKESFRDLSRFISIKTVYPKAAFAKKIQGGFIIGINIDGNGLISNVKFLANPGIHNAGFDEALLSAVNAYHGQIKEKAGMYKMGINFLIPGENQVNFPTPSTAKDANYVGETTILGLTDTGKKRLPPPPPAPPKPKVDQIKFPPPVVKPDKPAKKVKDQIKFPPPVVKPDKPANAQVNNMPPPPSPPFETIYEDLIKYVLKHARYPAIARDNNVNGHILLSLVINKDHKVTDVKVEKGIGYRCDEEAARALSTYTNTINKAPGKYKMVVTFMLVNNDNTKFYAPKPLGDDDLNVHNFIGEAVITGSIK